MNGRTFNLRYFCLSALSCMTAVVFSACSDDNDLKSAPEAGNGACVNPKDAKECIIDAGIEFSQLIDADAHRDVCQLFSDLVDKYEDFDFEAFENYLDKLAEEFNFIEEDYDMTPVRGIKALSGYVNEQNGGQLLELGQDIVEHYIVFQKLYGKFTADDKSETFRFDESVDDRLEIVMYDNDNNPVVFKLVGSESTTKLNCRIKVTENELEEGIPMDSESNSHKFEADVPEKITLSVTQNGKELVAVTVLTSLNLDAEIEYESNENSLWSDYYWDYEYEERFNVLTIDYSNISLSVTLEMDGCQENASVGMSRSAVVADNSLSIDGQSMYSIHIGVNGDYNDLDKNIKELFNEGTDNLIDYMDRMGLSADIRVDILDSRVTLDLSSSNIADLSNAVNELEDALDNELPKPVEKALEKVNGLFESGLYLDGEKTAYIQVDYFVEKDDFKHCEYWYSEPVLVFLEDQSSYRFNEYFTEESFERLIDAFNKTVEDFENLFNELDN